jgi:hypothetical protein
MFDFGTGTCEFEQNFGLWLSPNALSGCDEAREGG